MKFLVTKNRNKQILLSFKLPETPMSPALLWIFRFNLN